ncbi:YhcN/YlaJ family sporulation lipoprotein [Cerasibacillus quisquiliarum]|uniref:Putative lipoprotein YlaJ n=1 Tax=Cerasibacillus quisquiliarum TaxID=227865 RepID=A0A511UUM3_9BACI|nr:YhcN/YlaJ family sporulation lipoprotein [Cerasibacillus quisquiliarum]MBB5145735.1 YhcN/YlaJ family sporulation lipoprotein [Cerasibacillus quisquiliarum]GEN30306.1 putative lipoprotein YlaJ [Cerasibacillus quisquiliarum]
MTFRIIIILCFLLLTGCLNEENQRSLNERNERFLRVEQSIESNEQNITNTKIANHLRDIAVQSPQVKNATALVIGPYAVVGIDVNKKLDRSRVGTIKYTVSEALRNDPYGKTAVVIADADINQRLINMKDKINEGYPVQGIIEELAAIIGRYMPDLPAPQQVPSQPDQNKDILPEDNKEELDNIQDEQSNHEKNRTN